MIKVIIFQHDLHSEMDGCLSCSLLFIFLYSSIHFINYKNNGLDYDTFTHVYNIFDHMHPIPIFLQWGCLACTRTELNM
jgi:hypothetical protein